MSRVIRYQTDNGELYLTEKECNRRNAELRLESSLRCMELRYCTEDEVVSWIKDNRALVLEVLDE